MCLNNERLSNLVSEQLSSALFDYESKYLTSESYNFKTWFGSLEMNGYTKML